MDRFDALQAEVRSLQCQLRRQRRLTTLLLWCGAGVVLLGAGSTTRFEGDIVVVGELEAKRLVSKEAADFKSDVHIVKDVKVGGKIDAPDLREIRESITKLENANTTLATSLTALKNKVDPIDARSKYLSQTIEGPNDFLTIQMGKKKIRFQADGNLVIVGEQGKGIWHTDTWQNGR